MMLRPPRFMPPLGPPRPDPRKRILAQWRGRDLSPLEKIHARPARSAGQLLPHVLKELRIDRRQSEAEIARVWKQLIDPTIAAHAQPTGLAKGTLFVSVDSSVWLHEIILYRRKEILDRLQHSFGTDLIRRISFRVG